MANSEHCRLLKAGVQVWNKWRSENLDIEADLSGVDLSGRYLDGADLRGADLSGAMLRRAYLIEANLRGANLKCADFGEANLSKANLTRVKFEWTDMKQAILRNANLAENDLRGSELQAAFLLGADLRGANLQGKDLRRVDLSGADLSRAKLSGADLSYAVLTNTNLTYADLTGCHVYGASAWDLKLDGAVQKNLIITPRGQPKIQLDRLDLAQFVYLLLNNAAIRHVIDTITSKLVLILGRFTDERKAVLDAIRERLRQHDYVPVLFDFDGPESRDTHETITTLARMARFVIADITDPKGIPQELVSIVEQLPSVAVQPILLRGAEPWGMYDHIKRYPWVLPVATYECQDELVRLLEPKVIGHVEAKAKEIRTPAKRQPGQKTT